MNFTNKIKREIIEKISADACCHQAALSAFLRCAGTVNIKGGKLSFEINTESQDAASFFLAVLNNQYGAQIDLTNQNKKESFDCVNNAEHILKELGIAVNFDGGTELKMSIDKYIIENDCCAKSYVSGAFLGGGSATLPLDKNSSTGYHLEFVFSNETTAKDFTELLNRFNLEPKITKRKQSAVVYFKSSEEISDCLALMGASSSVLKLTDIVVKKSRVNDINRAVNCQTGNLIKQFDASIKQLQAIKNLKELGELDSLPPKLKEAAYSRLENNESSLSELAKILGISKSCLNHRLRKITDLSKQKGRNNFD